MAALKAFHTQNTPSKELLQQKEPPKAASDYTFIKPLIEGDEIVTVDRFMGMVIQWWTGVYNFMIYSIFSNQMHLNVTTVWKHKGKRRLIRENLFQKVDMTKLIKPLSALNLPLARSKSTVIHEPHPAVDCSMCHHCCGCSGALFV